MERAAEAYGIANSTAWDLVGKHEAGGLEALTPAKAGGANNQIIDTSVLPMLLLRFERTAEHERTAHLEVFCDSGVAVPAALPRHSLLQRAPSCLSDRRRLADGGPAQHEALAHQLRQRTALPRGSIGPATARPRSAAHAES